MTLWTMEIDFNEIGGYRLDFEKEGIEFRSTERRMVLLSRISIIFKMKSNLRIL